VTVDSGKLLVSVEEAMAALGIGRTTLHHLISEGRLDTVKIGRRRLVKVSSMRAMAEGSAQ
jgi:excisionase family DNA binding protein